MFKLEDYWKILAEIQGEDTDLIDAVKSLAKNEQSVVKKYISNVVDTPAHSSADWTRIKNFLIDWYATHRTIASQQQHISDVYSLPNDQLDELFRSFGYPYSTLIKDSTSNTPPQLKVQFFLDLVNLYKRKGTPQGLLDVFKYYGVSKIDIYEFNLQLEDRLRKNPNDLIFKGNITVGNSGDKSKLYLPYRFLTDSDPHWMQSEDDIRYLLANNKINFPSTTPYFAVKPVFDEEAIDTATGMFIRRVQDAHDSWEYNGSPNEKTNPVLPQNAVISILGEVTSILTLYLSCIYVFNKEFWTGAPADRFVCYDGTNTITSDILDEFNAITNQKITSREDWNDRWSLYKDTFSRPIDQQFLHNHIDAGLVLFNLNPYIKNSLDNLAAPNLEVLGTLLTDLGEWIRNNINAGFINISYILFGLESFFNQMNKVVDFFKPYRARLIPVEQLFFRNRLFNSVVTEDNFDNIEIDLSNFDYVTGNSHPCCTNKNIGDPGCGDEYFWDGTSYVLISHPEQTVPENICLDSTSDLFYSRETFDCGSYFDIGAATDLPKNEFVYVEDFIHDRLNCGKWYGEGQESIERASNLNAPNAPIVTSNLVERLPMDYDISHIDEGQSEFVGKMREVHTTLGYALTLNLFNEVDSHPNFYSHIITEKDYHQFKAKISGIADTDNYYVSCDYDNSDNSGIAHIPDGTNKITIDIPPPPEVIDSTSYTVAISLSNLIDPDPTCYHYTVIERTSTNFTVQLSDNVDSDNYFLEWILIAHDKQGIEKLSLGYDSVTIPLDPFEVNDNYGLSLELLNTVDSTSIIPFIVTDKRIDSFTVTFERPLDSYHYELMWSRPLNASLDSVEYKYYQTGEFINFDGVPSADVGENVYVEGTQGRFDCTFGQDMVHIEISDGYNYILQETSDYLLQETGDRLLLQIQSTY